MQTFTKTLRHHWLTIEVNVITAFAYFLMGFIGQLIAVPPGFATIIWPPAGLALAALLAFGKRTLPGIFVGAFSISVYIRISSGTE
ncbi:MAG: MASE1 domain-containing protein, partial [Pseudomonadota bacterium]|nr:MASE1 domain-containing protein [Pseudomonadota bacterium]